MAETFMINEIMKTHSNRGLDTPFFYYRDSNGNEVDLVMLYGGKLNMVECKSGTSYCPGDIKAFGRLPTDLEKDGCIVCLADVPYPVDKDVYAIPLKTVGYRFLSFRTSECQINESNPFCGFSSDVCNEVRDRSMRLSKRRTPCSSVHQFSDDDVVLVVVAREHDLESVGTEQLLHHRRRREVVFGYLLSPFLVGPVDVFFG